MIEPGQLVCWNDNAQEDFGRAYPNHIPIEIGVCYEINECMCKIYWLLSDPDDQYPFSEEHVKDLKKLRI